MLYENRGRAESFGNDAERYDRSRPSYPEGLFDEILGPEPEGLAVLDVGCGTGIAARAMAERGAEVLGVEIDPRMAAVARRRGCRVELGAFETWEPGERRFDRVTAAQAWHWVHPVHGAAKAASVLRPGGRLCVFWNAGHQPAALQVELDAIYERLAPGSRAGASALLGASGSNRRDPASGHAGEVEGIRACAALTEPVVRRFSWSRPYSRDAWLDQLPTHSDHATMAAADLDRLLPEVARAIDRAGGAFEMRYTTLLVSAMRR